MDLGVVGIPCPLFSSLNKNTRKRSRVTETYNPFEARLCSTHVKLFTRQITRSGQAVDHVNHLRIAEVPCYSCSFIFSHTPTHTHIPFPWFRFQVQQVLKTLASDTNILGRELQSSRAAWEASDHATQRLLWLKKSLGSNVLYFHVGQSVG